MQDLIKLATEHAEYLTMIAILLAIAIVSFYIVAFAAGREISFWPPKIGPKPNTGNRSAKLPIKTQGLGIADWERNSREVNDKEHWIHASELVIGVMYSPRFTKDFYDVLVARANSNRATTILVLDPDSTAAKFLKNSTMASGKIVESMEEIRHVVSEADKGRGYIRVRCHDRYLRYSFIMTEESIWFTFYTNSPNRAVVPALKFVRGSPVFEFLAGDIRRVQENSRG